MPLEREKEDMVSFIRAAVEARSKAIMDEEVEAAGERVRERMKAELGGIIMATMNRYEAHLDRNKIIIEVKRNI